MKPESIVFAVAGAFFGLIVGWVLGSQAAGPRPVAAPVAVTQQAAPAGQPQPGAMPPAQAPRPLDEAQARTMVASAEKNPNDADIRVQLGNLYFDAERYADAIKWYEDALKLNPKDANVSTDLGVAYYYANQPDRALQQFDHSLGLDPKHAKTMLNQGIVQAFGKQDIQGAATTWQKLIELAPTSPEAETAKRALQGLKSAHPGIGGAGSKPGA
ncbi:MAG TPA: tetratricopeptide repeat protein [Vicinamibacterales bacterium]|jgi:tetratricopeptide (TPR) repeat protein